jgi:hypothetical protein
MSSSGYLPWLKSLNRYSKSRINELGAIPPALGIFYTLTVCFASDFFLRTAWAITVSHTWNVNDLIILIIWNVPEPAIWFAFMTTYAAVAISSVLYGWINIQLSYSPAKRTVALVLANTVARSTTALDPSVSFQDHRGVQFPKNMGVCAFKCRLPNFIGPYDNVTYQNKTSLCHLTRHMHLIC